MTRLVLIGAGHAHLQVLRDWISAPLVGAEPVLVSPSTRAPYSGMVPGWLAGHYSYDEICVDVAALCASAGAEMLVDEVVALDADARRISLASGAVLAYDLLSLNVGSTLVAPTPPSVSVLSMRPLGRLRAAWEATLAQLAGRADTEPLRLVAVGGGAAGIESMLAIRKRLRTRHPGRTIDSILVSRGRRVLPAAPPGAVRRVERALRNAKVRLQLGRDYSDDLARPGDLVLWATGAQAHDWQRSCGLAIGAEGFIRIDKQLRSTSHPDVYAVGDCAEWAEPLPKAGVYAVRMGPVLARNLRAALGSDAPIEYAPQRRFLALLATGEGRAIGFWGRWSFEGAWVWRWKDWIDRSFVRSFAPGPAPDAAVPERSGACASSAKE